MLYIKRAAKLLFAAYWPECQKFYHYEERLLAMRFIIRGFVLDLTFVIVVVQSYAKEHRVTKI